VPSRRMGQSPGKCAPLGECRPLRECAVGGEKAPRTTSTARTESGAAEASIASLGGSASPGEAPGSSSWGAADPGSYQQIYQHRTGKFVTRRTTVAPSESLRHLLKLHVQSQLRFAGPVSAVKLPRGASEELWIDIHLVDFVNEAAALWSLVETQCATRCRDAPMAAGDRRVYEWEEDDDDAKGPPPARGEEADGASSAPVCLPASDASRSRRLVLPATKYVDAALRAAAAAIDDERLFPLDERAPYAEAFRKTAKTICTRLFRVYAHVYHAHFSAVVALRCDRVVNDLFRRFVLFALEFDLVDRAELKPLEELIRNLFLSAAETTRQAPKPASPDAPDDTTQSPPKPDDDDAAKEEDAAPDDVDDDFDDDDDDESHDEKDPDFKDCAYPLVEDDVAAQKRPTAADRESGMAPAPAQWRTSETA